ncbi:Zinc finger MYND domain-containing protein 12 [Geranomyces variabilis]|nr:Zinc finger MYND domain-containing protein 12 [Geranomyces variabilis]
MAGMNATNINPLSNPKGVKLGCELCGKPAYLRCDGCRVTYYCDKEHQETDWSGIHARICMLVVPLRTPVAILGSEEERAHRETQTRRRQVHLLELTKTEAHKKLYEEEYHLAIPAALQALRFSMQVYGPNSAQLVPAYLLLGESSIGLNQLAQAEDYLSLAKWALMKKRAAKRRGEPTIQAGNERSSALRVEGGEDSDGGGRETAAAEGGTGGGGGGGGGDADEADEDHEVLALLNRNFGLLYLKKGKTEEAIRYFALDIYHSSIAKNDPEDLSVTGGYFHLGNVFNLLPTRADDCHALFERVAEIWRAALMRDSDTLQLDEAQQAEGVQILTAITVATANEPVPAAAKRAGATAQHALALLLARDGPSQEKARAAAAKAIHLNPKAAEMDAALKKLAAIE